MSITWIDRERINSIDDLTRELSSSSGDLISIANNVLRDKINETELINKLDTADIIHAGLSLGTERAFQSVQLCTFNWYFLTPVKDKDVISWKASLDFIIFNRKILRAIGLPDQRYKSPDAAIMDWVYRALVYGCKPVCIPLKIDTPIKEVSVDLEDEFLFVSKHFNRRATNYFRFCHLFLNGKLLKAPPLFEQANSRIEEINDFKLLSTNQTRRVDSYSALIPTINRYNYIQKSIDSLLSLKFPPSEIVVVDQTPAQYRKTAVYDPYLKLGLLKLIYLDTAGQSTARNRGLELVTQPWVLLFEDDSEAWPDMVDEHINLIERSNCDVSTGVIVPPGADCEFIPVANRRYFLADILTTGNAFMKTETAVSAGGFDKAFDRGPGADDDFGKRLYLMGKTIVYNYKSIETHHKAPQGGMREHGIWWRNKSTLFGPYPPVTQSFVIIKYYPPQYRLFLFLNMILKARKKYSIASYILFFLLLPYKLIISVAKANKLDKTL